MAEPKFTVDRPAAVERLEQVRRAFSMTKGAFSETIAMYPSNYSRLLKGEFFLTADQLYTVWRLYGADPCYIMGGSRLGMPRDLLSRIEGVDQADQREKRA